MNKNIRFMGADAKLIMIGAKYIKFSLHRNNKGL